MAIVGLKVCCNISEIICLPDDCFHSSSPTRCLLLDALAWWFCRWVCIVSVHLFSARCLLLGALAESFVLVFFSFFTPYALHLPRCCLLLGALGKWFCSGCACICTWCLGCLGRMILQYVCFHFLSLITRVVFFVGCLGYVILHFACLHFLAVYAGTVAFLIIIISLRHHWPISLLDVLLCAFFRFSAPLSSILCPLLPSRPEKKVSEKNITCLCRRIDFPVLRVLRRLIL